MNLESLPQLTAEAGMRVGSIDNPEIGFSRISGVDVDRDGQIYVGEAMDLQIRVYSAQGQHLHRFGGRGGGPGEFQGNPRFGVLGDTVWAYDNAARRITLFDRAGKLLSAAPVSEVMIPLPEGTGFVMPWAMRPDGTFSSEFLRVSYSRDVGSSGVQPTDSIPVPRVRFSAQGAVLDTIGWDGWPPPRMWRPPRLESSSSRFQSIEVGSQRYGVPDPPTTLPLWVPLHDGRIIVTVPIATMPEDGAFTVTRLGLSGDTVYTRTYHYQPARFTDEDLDSIAMRAARREGVTVNGQPLPLPDNITGIAARLRGEMMFPEFRTPVDATRLDAEERLWLRRNDPEHPTARWIVLDDVGIPIGQLELPRNVRILWSRGNEFWAVVPDDLDVPWLVKYRLKGV